MFCKVSSLQFIVFSFVIYVLVIHSIIPKKHQEIHRRSWNILSQPFGTNTVCHKIFCNYIVSFPKDLVDLTQHSS